MDFLNDKQAGYEMFLPAVTAEIRKKSKVIQAGQKKVSNDDNLTDAEFQAIVAVVFRDAVIQFIRESKLYRVDIPIDVYQGVKWYDVIPPEGYYVASTFDLKIGAADTPSNYLLDDNTLTLYGCCPEKSVDKAWYVDAAVVPLRTVNPCKFSVTFLDMYYDAILACMRWKLSQMPERQWHQLGTIQYNQKEYYKLRNRAVVGGTDSSKPVKLKYRRLSGGLS